MSFSFSLRAVLSCAFTVESADSSGASSDPEPPVRPSSAWLPRIEPLVSAPPAGSVDEVPGVYSHMSDPAAPAAVADATATATLMLWLLLIVSIDEVGTESDSGSDVKSLSARVVSALGPSVQIRKAHIEQRKSDIQVLCQFMLLSNWKA